MISTALKSPKNGSVFLLLKIIWIKISILDFSILD